MTTTLSVLAVDDEAPALDELVYLLRNSAVASHVRAVSSATDALRHLHDEHFDVVLLDIAMPGMDGLELARVVAQFSHPPAIVFVTAHEEHALAAFDVGGSGYLLKPVTQERLVTALRRVALPRQEDHPDDGVLETIPVEIGTLTKMVSRDEVSWAESSGDYVRLHLRDGTRHLVRLPMSLLEEHWRDHGFARIHRSYLVSLREITRGEDVAGPHGRRRRHLRPSRQPPPFQGAQGQARAPRAAVAGPVTAEPLRPRGRAQPGPAPRRAGQFAGARRPVRARCLRPGAAGVAHASPGRRVPHRAVAGPGSSCALSAPHGDLPLAGHGPGPGAPADAADTRRRDLPTARSARVLVRTAGGTVGAAVRRVAQGTMTEPASIVAIVTVTAITALIGARGVRVARTPADFLVAARQVPATLNASAISGEYLSAASFLGVAGLAMLEGLGALWYAVGYAAGYLVLLAAVAAPLRRFGAYTIPDFAEGRLGSPALRRAATATVIVICGFYLLPQLKGAGVTLQVAVGGPVWIGVVVLGGIVTLGIASGGMKGITFVQAFQYWLKIVAIAVPALVLLAFVQHPPVSTVTGAAPPTFMHRTVVEFPQSQVISVTTAVDVEASGTVDEVSRHGRIHLTKGRHAVASGATLTFPAGSHAPHVEGNPVMSGAAWTSPLLQLGGRPDHALAATYGVLLATVLGAHGTAPHFGSLLHQPRRTGGPPHHRVRPAAARLLLRLSRRCSRCSAGWRRPASTRRARPIRWCWSCPASWPPAASASSSGHSSPPAPSPPSSRPRRGC